MEQKTKIKSKHSKKRNPKIIIEDCDLSKLLGSLYGFNHTQILLFEKILTHPRVCCQILEKMTDLKNNAIQKNLKTLLDAGLIEREAVSLSEFREHCKSQEFMNFKDSADIKNERGYLFLYKSKSIQQIHEIFSKRMEGIQKNLDEFAKLSEILKK